MINKITFYIGVILIIMVYGCSKGNDTLLESEYDILDTKGRIQLSERDKNILENDKSAQENHDFLNKASNAKLLAHEVRLKYLAKALAASLNNEELVSIIKNKAMNKFDGDTEILWEMVKDQTLKNGNTIRQHITSKFNKDERSILPIKQIERVPLLNILYLPSNNRNNKDFRVTYIPVTKNDVEVDSVIAYDSNLNKFNISFTEPSDFPLFVVGVNERVDPINKEPKSYSLKKTVKTTSDYTKGACLLLCEAWLYDDKEPFLKGAAEIYFRVFAYDGSGNEIEDDRPIFTCMNYDNSGWELETGGCDNKGHWTSDNDDDDHVDWLPDYFFDTDDNSDPQQCKIIVMEEDAGEDDRIERYWSLTEGAEGDIKFDWPSSYSYHRYYGGGNSRDCDLKIKAVYNSTY